MVVVSLVFSKANLTYMPLDVNAPSGRIEAILSEVSGRKLVLLGAHVPEPKLQDRVPDVELVRIDDALSEDYVNGHVKNAYNEPTATSLAYAIFTSGSTGRPKGVMLEHRAIMRLVKHERLCIYASTGTSCGDDSQRCF